MLVFGWAYHDSTFDENFSCTSVQRVLRKIQLQRHRHELISHCIIITSSVGAFYSLTHNNTSAIKSTTLVLHVRVI